MCAEVMFGMETFVMDVSCRFGQHAPVERVVELEVVDLQVIADVFHYGERHFMPFVVRHVAHHPFAVAHEQLHDELFQRVETTAFRVVLGNERFVGSCGSGGARSRGFCARRVRCRSGRLGCRHVRRRRCRGCPAFGRLLGLRLCIPLLFERFFSLCFFQFGYFSQQQFFVHLQQLAAFLHIDRTDNRVRDDSNAPHDVADESGTFDWVAAGIVEQQVGLEADEVHFVRVDIILIICRIVLAGEAVRIVAVGQEDDFDVHTFFEQHVDAAEGSLDTGHVAVIKHGDVVREAVDEADLSGGERSA